MANPSSSPSDPPRVDSSVRDQAVLGALLCLAAAALYALTNICMRRLSETFNYPWAVFLKESVAVSLVGPWLVWGLLRGKIRLPDRTAAIWLFGAGLATQIIGNLLQFYALSTAGLVVTVPCTLGANLITAAIQGRLLLGERVAPRSIVAMGVVLGAVVLLTWSSSAHFVAKHVSLDHPEALLGAAAACIAGFVFAHLGIAVRKAGACQTSTSVIVVVTTGLGVLSIGPWSYFRCGIEPLLEIPPEALAIVLTAGIFNMIAFASIVTGFQLTSLLHANVTGASQTAFAAIAGILLFAEPFRAATAIGVAAMIAGLLLVDRPTPESQA
jgi:DME family drug/metabolite transporter